jgi:uncharacterized membrane protein
MNTSNKIIVNEALEALKGKWKLVIKVTAIFFIISLITRFIPLLGPIVSLIIAGPIALGMASFYLSISRKQNATLEQVFEGFNTWVRGLKAYLLVLVYTILWTLLFIIPGFIAIFAYSQTYYILTEDKNIGVNEAIKKSRAIMKGNKWKLFLLMLRFIGWGILCIFTLGIGLLWLIPYMNTASARFYDSIKEKKEGTIPEAVPTPVPASN